MLLVMAASGCTSTKDDNTNISLVVTPTETDTPDEEETVASEDKGYDDGDCDDNGCDRETYRIEEDSGIEYIGSVPNIECRKDPDTNRIKFGISLYNPEEDETDRDVDTIHIDAVKISCTYYADGKKFEKEYRPVSLTKPIEMEPGDSCTLRVVSGNILRDLGMEKDDGPIFCWIGLLDNGKELIATEIEVESQGSGEVAITRIGETKIMWDQ
jgi:hypothetical protein